MHGLVDKVYTPNPAGDEAEDTSVVCFSEKVVDKVYIPKPAGDEGEDASVVYCSSEQAPEDASVGSPSEQVLPEQPKQWKAQPPTRHIGQCSGENVVSFDTLLTDLFQHIADLSEHLRELSEMRDHIFAQHHWELNHLSDENVMLRSEIQRKGHAIEPFSKWKSVTDSKGVSGSRIQKDPQIQLASRLSDCYASFQSKKSLRGANAVSGFHSENDEMRAISSVMRAVSSNMNIRPTFSSRGLNLRQEWLLDVDELNRISAVPTAGRSTNARSMSKLTRGWTTTSDEDLWQVPLHPEHGVRLCWDMFAATLLGYDTIMLPLYLFELHSNDTTRLLDWFTAIFWTLDVFVSFSTGTFVKGRLEMGFFYVSKDYAKSWMLPDFLMILLEWILIASWSNQSGALSSVGAVRNLRILRFVRLLRLAKFERLINQLTRRINSIYFLLSLRIVTMVIAIVVANHMLASIWYAIGTNGWVALHLPDKSDVLYCYLTSFHWSLTQFHGSTNIAPTNLEERLFSVLTLLFALIAVTWFVSSMTNSMLMLQNVHQERTEQRRSLLEFLAQRNASKPLAVRIKEHVAVYHRENAAIIPESQVELLSVLPKNLLIDLHEEVRGNMIKEHPVFQYVETCFMHCWRQLTHEGVQELHASSKEDIFCAGAACNRMFFVNSEMVYSPGQMRRNRIDLAEGSSRLTPYHSNNSSNKSESGDSPPCIELRGKTWLSEPVLWVTTWMHCGTLSAVGDSTFYTLQVESFLRAVCLYETVRLDVALYAKTFCEHLKLVEPSDLANCVDAMEIWEQVMPIIDPRHSNYSGLHRQGTGFLAASLQRQSSVLWHGLMSKVDPDGRMSKASHRQSNPANQQSCPSS